MSHYTLILLYLSTIIELIVYKYATTIFADHHLFTLAYFALLLWRNRIVTTSASVSHHRHYCQPIAVTFAYAIVGIQQTFIHAFAGSFRNIIVMFFFFFSFINDLIELSFFMVKRSLFICDLFFNNFQRFYLFSKFFIGIANMFF